MTRLEEKLEEKLGESLRPFRVFVILVVLAVVVGLWISFHR